MSNDYYTHSSWPATGAAGRSADARSEMDAIQTGFDKLAPLTGNAYKIAYVNAGATAWDVLGGTGLVKLRAAAIPILAVDGTDYISPAGAATLTNKIIVVASNTITTAAHGTLAATELNAALAELADDDAAIALAAAATAAALSAHITNPTGAHAASAIANTPAGGIAATTVQDALNELDTEKAPLDSPALTGNPTAPTPALGDNDTSIATTAFVAAAFADGFGGGGFSFKNKIINGGMVIAQRGTSFAAAANNTYTLDRWLYGKNGAMVHTIAQGTNPPTVAQAGEYLGNELSMTLTTPDNAIAAGEYCIMSQVIEGFNFRSIAQRTFTLSFWVFASVPGTYCVSFCNSAADRSYVAEYTINAGGAWEKKTITVPASPAAGTWNYANGVGLSVRFALASGTTLQTTPNAWTVGNFLATANQVNGVATGAVLFGLAGVQVEAGAIATLFESRPIEVELALCQRYYEKSFQYSVVPAQNAGITQATSATVTIAGAVASVQSTPHHYQVTKRAIPTLTFFNPSAANANVRNASKSNDGNTTTINISNEKMFHLAQTGQAGWAVGDLVAIAWTSDAEL